MTLRGKLLLAQTPLVCGLLVLAALAGMTISRLGEHSTRILQDNYRSVLAAQRMKEAIERMDSGALYLLAGRPAQAEPQIAANQRIFSEELAAEENNLTEDSEREAATLLRQRWNDYLSRLQQYRAITDQQALNEDYFGVLAPAFKNVKESAERILVINQDAMVRKSDLAQRSSRNLMRLILVAALTISMLAIWCASWLTSRLLRPLGIVGQAVRRFGEGDVAARARIRSSDEIGKLAADFNAMADSLERYRRSSLGELLQTQRNAQAALDSLPDPVVMLGLDSVLNVNEAASHLLKIDVDASAAETLKNVPSDLRALLEQLRGHVLSGHGQFVSKEFNEAVRLQTSEGDRYLLPRASPIHGEDGQVVGAAIVLADVTRFRRADELKNNLVAFVAHEFRTPLTSLQMAIHLCAEEAVGPLTEKQADMLFAARQDCERLQQIVTDLLDVSRMEEGQLVLDRQSLDPEELAAATINAHQNDAQARGQVLRSEILPGTPKISADPDRIRIALTNLVANALRHTPPGGEIVIRAKQVDHRLCFEVHDTGPGIPQEHRALVFEKFYRVPGTKSEGAGLGLFIARQIAQAHGGSVGVESEMGKGSTFWFTVDLATTLEA